MPVNNFSGYQSLERQCIMRNFHRKVTYTQTRLQLHLSMCDISADVIKEQMHSAERPLKRHTKLTKPAAFFEYAYHPTGHHAL